MSETLDRLLRMRAVDDPTKLAVIDPVTRINYGELDLTTRVLAERFVGAGVGTGSRVGLIMPNGARWVQIAFALTRIGAVLVPLSTLLQPPELLAQLRIASVQCLVTVEEFRGHRYVEELTTELDLASPCEHTIYRSELPALRRICIADSWKRCPQVQLRRASSRRWRRPSRPLIRSSSCSPQAAAECRRASSTPTATPLAPCDPVWRHGASTPTPGCTCRCRSSG